MIRTRFSPIWCQLAPDRGDFIHDLIDSDGIPGINCNTFNCNPFNCNPFNCNPFNCNTLNCNGFNCNPLNGNPNCNDRNPAVLGRGPLTRAPCPIHSHKERSMIQFRCLQCGKETELQVPGRFEEPPFLWPLDHTCPECLHRESDAAEGDDEGDVEPPVDDDLEDHFTHFQF